VELLVAALIAAVLLVVAGRFLFRSPSGKVVLPSVIDESVGMWALRRITGLRLWERPDPDEEAAAAAAAVAWPDPEARARYEASRRAGAAGGVALRNPAGSPSTAGSRWPNRLAALLAVISIVIIAVTVVGLTILPREDPGAASTGDVPGGSGAPSGSALAVAGSASPGTSAAASGAVSSNGTGASGSAIPSARASTPAGPTPATGQTPAPSTGPGLTPPPGATPTPRPAPTATPKPSSTPVPTPTPTPPPPLKAVLSCSAVALLATCDASDSTGATTYEFDFGDGSAPVEGPSTLALHAYLAPGLTVGP
jgi:hypothetical protein